MENHVSQRNLLPVSPPKYLQPTHLGKKTTTWLPCSPLDSRGLFQDIHNVTPHSPEINRNCEAARSTVSEPLETRMKSPFPVTCHYSSPSLSPRTSLARSSTDAPLVFIQPGDKMLTLCATAESGLSKMRIKASTEHIFRAPFWVPEQPLSAQSHCSQSPPPQYSLDIDSEPFNPLKGSSASSNSLEVLQGNLVDKRSTKGAYYSVRDTLETKVDHRNTYLDSLRCDKTALVTNNVHFPINALPTITSSPDPVLQKLCRRPALTRPAGYDSSRKLSGLAASRCNEGTMIPVLIQAGHPGGLPTDMLDTLNNLETLASRVKTLEQPCDVIPQNVEDILSRKGIREERPWDVSDVIPAWNRLEKEKWRAPDTHDIQTLSVSANPRRFCPGLPVPQPLVSVKPPLPPMHWRLYNPNDAPEFLVGCSSSLTVHAVHGYKSKSAPFHQRSTTFRKLSLPSRRQSSKRKCHGTPPSRLQPELLLPTLPGLISQNPPSKPSAFKSLLRKSRPQSRSDIHVSQSRRVQDRSAHFPKLRFNWFKN